MAEYEDRKNDRYTSMSFPAPQAVCQLLRDGPPMLGKVYTYMLLTRKAVNKASSKHGCLFWPGTQLLL